MGAGVDEDEDEGADFAGEQLRLELHEALKDGFASMLVDKVSDKKQYETWGENAASIAKTIEAHLARILPDNEADLEGWQAPTPELQNFADGFAEFLGVLRDSLSPMVSYQQARQMIAQHVVTIPVFKKLFERSRFLEENPISAGIRALLDYLPDLAGTPAGHPFSRELAPLDLAYQRMVAAFEGAVDSAGRLDILKDIYDGFFRAAMPKEVKSLGIAYTPTWLVDFMWRSVDDICREKFNRGITAENVHVLDPFTGTGTYIARLMQLQRHNGEYMIADADLERKFTGRGTFDGKTELHANEVLLLSYYIASLKLEETYHERRVEAVNSAGSHGDLDVDYQRFTGMVLTDTLLMNPQGSTPPRSSRGCKPQRDSQPTMRGCTLRTTFLYRS